MIYVVKFSYYTFSLRGLSKKFHSSIIFHGLLKTKSLGDARKYFKETMNSLLSLLIDIYVHQADYNGNN